MTERKTKRGFSLVEMTTAVGILAGGILVLISLFTLGFKENRMSREDTAAAALADDVLSRLETALSCTNIPWGAWTGLFNGKQNLPEGGWRAYMNTYLDAQQMEHAQFNVDPTAKATATLANLAGDLSMWLGADAGRKGCENILAPPDAASQGLTWALVLLRDPARPQVISATLRVVRKNRYAQLLSQPAYYTEICFQGDPTR